MQLVFGILVIGALVWLIQPAATDGSRTTGRWSGWHWYLGGLGAFLLLAMWTIAPRSWWQVVSPERQARALRGAVMRERLWAVTRARDAVLAEMAVQSAVERTRGVRQFVLVDTGVPKPAAAFVDSLMHAELRRLDLADTALQVFITRPVSDSSRSNALRSRRPLDISWLLPDSTRSTCLTVVRLNRDEVSNLLIATGTSLLGPCALVARFGRPGPSVDRWLRATEYAFAGYAGWTNKGLGSGRDDEEVFSRSGLTASQRRCVVGDLPSCRALLAIDSSAVVAEQPEFTPVTFRDFAMGGPRLGRYERLFVSDLVRDMGTERFAEFWRSTAPVDSALARASGQTLEAGASRWMRRFYDSTPGGPAKPEATLGALALALVVGAIATARRAPDGRRRQ